ncbi:LOW QUALITY PROTEIN: geranylgeranyl transferase type-1 subunit beta [Phalaenopsis equestris]|uniref:LOW QUALITY PROTEIN: geranylgeranyl transferase type-1 subunit beta n=1 Tax=Phalaenopsis equestris TaxID=78828 RepID=UPI0009E28F5B|nr:LOW QUALITY PROTEIN: geranylgeranyl transferase type-1 subunit beta [Phalaenopsis equestris]
MDPATFDRERHVAFLEMMLERLPEEYESQEINRLTIAYFVISGLAVLDALDRVNKDQLVRWVLSFQEHPKSDADLKNGQFYGFGGSAPPNTLVDGERVSGNNCSHLASTYCALAILKIVGYSFSNCCIEPILVSMRELQLPDGSFMPIHTGAEADLRFLYCAAAICFMLNNWTGMDKTKAKEYILKCQSYDGGFGLVPGAESHGGATYCAVSALHLMGYLETAIISKFSQRCVIDVPLLVEWSLQRQSVDGGFQGRANKPSDTCYAFWVGGVLKLLGGYHFCNKEALRSFLLSCQSKFGGFKKFPDITYPDLYHSFYGFSALSLLEEPGLRPLQVELGIPLLVAAGI